MLFFAGSWCIMLTHREKRDVWSAICELVIMLKLHYHRVPSSLYLWRFRTAAKSEIKMRWLWCYVRVRVINYKYINSMDWNSANTRYIYRRTEERVFHGKIAFAALELACTLYDRIFYYIELRNCDIDAKIEILREGEINFFLFLYLYFLFTCNIIYR